MFLSASHRYVNTINWAIDTISQNVPSFRGAPRKYKLKGVTEEMNAKLAPVREFAAWGLSLLVKRKRKIELCKC